MLEEKHGVACTNATVSAWCRQHRRLVGVIERQEFLDALDAYVAMIDSMGPATDGPIQAAVPPPVSISQEPSLAIDEEVVLPIASGSAPIVFDDSLVGDAIPVADSIGSIFNNAVGAIADEPIAVGGSSVPAAIPVAQSLGSMLDTGADATVEGPITNRFKQARPFYGPDINPDNAFNASGSIDKGGAAEYAASMKSAASTIKKRASPKRRENPIDSTPMGPLP